MNEAVDYINAVVEGKKANGSANQGVSLCLPFGREVWVLLFLSLKKASPLIVGLSNTVTDNRT